MPQSVLIDAGPIVAYLRRDDEFHDWAALQFGRFPNFITCDAVLAEACARLNYFGLDQSWVVDLLVAKVLRVDFDTNREADRVSRLMKKYADCEMDFADACLVAMADELGTGEILTLNSDFRHYRWRRNRCST